VIFIIQANFLSFNIIFIPASVLLADSNSLKPVVIAILLLIFRWSCSTILFNCFTLDIFMFYEVKLLLFQVVIQAVLASLLSILIILGFPLFPIAFSKTFELNLSFFFWLVESLLYFLVCLRLYVGTCLFLLL